jgi:hypothetical protein
MADKKAKDTSDQVPSVGETVAVLKQMLDTIDDGKYKSETKQVAIMFRAMLGAVEQLDARLKQVEGKVKE